MYQLKNIISPNFLLICIIICSYSYVYAYEPSAKKFFQLINSSTEVSEFLPIKRVNPAIISQDSTFAIISEIFPYKYGISELKPISLSVYSPLIDNFAQLKTSIYGVFNSVFNEFTVDASVGIKVSQDMAIGAELEYSRFEIARSNNYSTYGVSLGTIIKLLDWIDLGMSMKISNQYDNSKPSIQQSYLGVGIKIYEGIYSDAGFRIDFNDQVCYYLRTKIVLNDLIALRVGYQSMPNSIQVGALINISENYSFTLNIEKSEFVYLNSFIQLGVKL